MAMAMVMVMVLLLGEESDIAFELKLPHLMSVQQTLVEMEMVMAVLPL